MAHATAATVAQGAAVSKPLRDRLAFSLLMSGGMVTLMSFYNMCIHHWFQFTAAEWLLAAAVRWPIAFALTNTLSNVLLAKVSLPAFTRIAKEGTWLHRHLRPVAKVCTMVPFMTLLAAFLLADTLAQVPIVWLVTFVTTLPAAIVANIYFVDPVARRIFQAVFGRPF